MAFVYLMAVSIVYMNFYGYALIILTDDGLACRADHARTEGDLFGDNSLPISLPAADRASPAMVHAIFRICFVNHVTFTVDKELKLYGGAVLLGCRGSLITLIVMRFYLGHYLFKYLSTAW